MEPKLSQFKYEKQEMRIVKRISEILDTRELLDVTLAAGSRMFNVHRQILTKCQFINNRQKILQTERLKDRIG